MRCGETGRRESGVLSQCGYVRTTTFGRELPAVVRAADRVVDHRAIGQSSEAVRAHVEKRAQLAVEPNDHVSLTDEFDSRGRVAERVDASDRMPDVAQSG